MKKLGIIAVMIWMAFRNVAASDALPVVNIYNQNISVSEPNGQSGFLIVKDTKEALVAHVELIGTAKLGVDYRIVTNSYVKIIAGTNSDFFVTMDSTCVGVGK